MAPKKEAAKKAPAKRTAKTAKTIRNLRFTPVHMRLGSTTDPYRVQLAPRGQYGDTSSIPVALQEDHAFVAGQDILFEVITTTEARKIEYAPHGYQETEVVRVERPDDTTVSTQDEWDGKGQVPQRRIGPKVVNRPGSDETYAEQVNPAMPSEVPTKVVIERTKSQN